ncbi:vomeronasal type-2 receptor 26-like [Podarcis lilfordi]|uniref:Vomeronasal type-2 receptor 26-like n=1 Tax=Podarcis lilfordi TaxID=74358 RepID=A0AA35L664_9SAUR|nr:vomeronasal type-2 receptor 26-like [Podarcis lilfordi]
MSVARAMRCLCLPAQSKQPLGLLVTALIASAQAILPSNAEPLAGGHTRMMLPLRLNRLKSARNVAKAIIGLINAGVRETPFRPHSRARTIREISTFNFCCCKLFKINTPSEFAIDLINQETKDSVLPGEIVLMPTQLAGPLPPKVAGLILPKFSAAKEGIQVIPGVLDPDYIGTILVQLWSHMPMQLKKGESWAHLVVLPSHPTASIMDTNLHELSSFPPQLLAVVQRIGEKKLLQTEEDNNTCIMIEPFRFPYEYDQKGDLIIGQITSQYGFLSDEFSFHEHPKTSTMYELLLPTVY